MLPGSNAAVLLSPAMGKPFAEASRGSDPTLIVTGHSVHMFCGLMEGLSMSLT